MNKTPLNEEQLAHLCYAYNEEGGKKALEFLLDNNICDEKQQKELTRLLYEAKKDIALRDNKKYLKDLEKFLTQFGMRFDYHHAYCKLQSFTVVREYFKSVEIEAISPIEALNKAKATYAFDEVASMDPGRTYVEGTEIED